MDKNKEILTKKDSAVMSLQIFLIGIGASGLCLLFIITIPGLFISLPLALLGLIMLVVSPFMPTKIEVCPECGVKHTFLTSVKSYTCPECHKRIPKKTK
jgi:hypothetical protein